MQIDVITYQTDGQVVDEITNRLIQGNQGSWNLYVFEEHHFDLQTLERRLNRELGTKGVSQFSIVENTSLPYPIPRGKLYLIMIVSVIC